MTRHMKHLISRVWSRISRYVSGQKLSHEAFVAYYYRLPQKVSVSWKRDGKMIVGKVSDGTHEFVTQGRNADDFIKMVNDALITVHEIPEAYIDELRLVGRTFEPDPQERAKLEDRKVTHAALPFLKRPGVLKAA